MQKLEVSLEKDKRHDSLFFTREISFRGTFAANMSEVNRSYSRSVAFSLFCFEICFLGMSGGL